MNLRIKDILLEQNKKAVWLSKQIGVTDVNTRNIINGVVTPKMETLDKIAAALNVPIWQLFVSPEEVNTHEDKNTITCPNCGKRFKMEE